MVLEAVRERISHLIKQDFPKICKTSLQDYPQFYIQALIGISLTKTDIILVNLGETIKTGSDFSPDTEDDLPSHESICACLRHSLPELCAEALEPSAAFSVEALIGLTWGSHVILVHIKEVVQNTGHELKTQEDTFKPESCLLTIKHETKEEMSPELTHEKTVSFAMPDELHGDAVAMAADESDEDAVAIGADDKITDHVSDDEEAASCVICQGDKALGTYHGVYCCHGCRSFFRRSLKVSGERTCRASNDCVIDAQSRRKCKACRFRRCVEAGMIPHSARDESLEQTNDVMNSSNHDNQDGGGSETDEYDVNEPVSDDVTNDVEKEVESPSKLKRKKVRPTKVLTCTYCDYNTVFWTTMKRHECTHTGQKPYNPTIERKCELCDFSTLHRGSLRRHILAHKGIKPAAPPIVKAGRPRKKAKQHVCQHCGYNTCHIGSLRRHIRAKHPETMDESERIVCPHCPDRKLSDQYQLKLHIRNYHNTSLICPCHGQKFVSAYGLKQHIEGETGTGRFACTVCDRRFVDRREVRDHMNKHTGARPYQCNYCGKDFTWKSGLRNHLMACKVKHAESVHDSDTPLHRPFPCTIDGCNKSFNRPGLLRDHVNGFHIGGMYQCTVCLRKYNYRDKLVKHMKKKHPPEKEPGEVFNHLFPEHQTVAAQADVTQGVQTIAAQADVTRAVQTIAAQADVTQAVQTIAAQADVTRAVQTIAAQADVTRAVQTIAAQADVTRAVQTIAAQADVTRAVQTIAAQADVTRAVQTDAPPSGSASPPHPLPSLNIPYQFTANSRETGFGWSFPL